MNDGLRLNLGAGNTRLDGFVSVDLYDEAADVRADICELPYADHSVAEIVAYQVIEHLPYWKTHSFNHSSPQFFEECYRVLKPGGVMITECPDLRVIAQRIVDTDEVTYNSMINLYGEYYRPWDVQRYTDWQHQAGSLHINGFTWHDIRQIAAAVGFKVRRQTMREKHPLYQYGENLSVAWTKPRQSR